MCPPVIRQTVLAATLIGAAASFPALAAEGKEEVLLGVRLNADDIELFVASGGCTKKEDFSVEVDKGASGKPTYLVTVRRTRPDHCKAFLPEGTAVKFSKAEIGLSGVIEMTLTNKIGNTSQHR